MPASESPLLARVIFKDVTGTTTLHTYDSFNIPGNDIHITHLTLTFNQQANPVAVIKIEDSGNTISQELINGARVFIDLGKSSPAYTRYFAGHVRNKQIIRSATGAFEIELTVYGSAIRFSERITNFFRAARRSVFGTGTDPDPTDTNAQAQQLMKDLITKTDHLPIEGPLETLTTSGIDSAITEIVPSISISYNTLAEAANQINDTVGTVWGVDGNDDVFMKYPTLTPSGVVVKDVKAVTDSANTCYFVNGWSFNDDILKAHGFANRLYGRGGTSLTVDQFNTTDTTSTGLHDRSLAMQFIPGNSWNAQAISMLLHKVGTVPARLQCVLRTDDNDSPGSSIAAAWIDTGAIGATSTQVIFGFSGSFVHLRNMAIGARHWIQLTKTGGDASNTVYWHRDTGTTGRNAYRLTTSWTVQSNSYKFTLGQLVSRNVLVEASDSASIAKYGVVEEVVDTPWVVEGATIDKYLATLLQITAKPRRIYNIPRCTVPDSLPMPGQTVELVDTKTGFSTGNTAELLELKIDMDASSNGMGTNYISLSLIQFPDDERLLART